MNGGTPSTGAAPSAGQAGAASAGRPRGPANRLAVFLRIVMVFVLFGPLVFTAAAMLVLAAFVLVIEPRNLGDVATVSVGAVLIAYLVGLLPAAATGVVVAVRDIGFGGASPLMAALTGAGSTAVILLAAAGARGGLRIIVKYPAFPLWLLVSAAMASLVCWWVVIGRGGKARRLAGERSR